MPFSLLVWGQSHIPSGLASILNALTPLATILVAHVPDNRREDDGRAARRFYRILAVAGATWFALVTFLVPISAILLGWLVLDEHLALRHFLGMAMIGLGLASVDGHLGAVLRRLCPA